MPRIIPRETLGMVSKKFTLAFSNVPGPIKPYFYYGPDGRKIKTLQSATYMITAGKIGLNINCMSFCNSLLITGTSDLYIFEDIKSLVNLIEENISEEIKKHYITLDE